MGVHFTVTVDHDLRDTSLDAVRERFQALQPYFDALSDQSLAEDTRWRDVSEPGTAPPNLFYTPGRFSLHIGPAALLMHHCTRFTTFIEVSADRKQLRLFSRKLAGLFGRRRALYAPCEGIGDHIADWVSDGLPLAEMEAKLRQRSRPPACIEELADRSWPDLRYYIDEFGDCCADSAG
jgi:hypothetical protein